MRREVVIINIINQTRWIRAVLTCGVLVLLLAPNAVAQQGQGQAAPVQGQEQEREQTKKPAQTQTQTQTEEQPFNGSFASADAGASGSTERKKSKLGIGLGVAVERRFARDANSSDVWAVTFLPRFMARGVGPAFDLPWNRVGAVTALGSQSTELSVIRLKPTLFGASWQEPFGRGFSVELQFLAGYSFNSVKSAGKDRQDAQVVVPQAITEIDNSFAWQPRVALWRDVGPVGLMVAGRYVHTRPKLTFADGTSRTWNADRVSIEFGIAFTLVKAPWAQ